MPSLAYTRLRGSCVTKPSCATASTTASDGMATPSSNFASATARYVRGVRYATSRDVVISTTSVRASSASRSKIWTPPSADTVNVGPVAQTDVGTVKATSEKANVTASPIIVVGIYEASLERGNGRRTMRLSQSYTYSQLLQQRSPNSSKNLVSRVGHCVRALDQKRALREAALAKYTRANKEL